jgi:hypothetical protein
MMLALVEDLSLSIEYEWVASIWLSERGVGVVFWLLCWGLVVFLLTVFQMELAVLAALV